ncbi:hypothetical protein Bca101_020357 [Brassica carinata]
MKAEMVKPQKLRRRRRTEVVRKLVEVEASYWWLEEASPWRHSHSDPSLLLRHPSPSNPSLLFGPAPLFPSAVFSSLPYSAPPQQDERERRKEAKKKKRHHRNLLRSGWPERMKKKTPCRWLNAVVVEGG